MKWKEETLVSEQLLDVAADLSAARSGQEPSAVSSNLYCWLWAAFPPKRGRLDVPRAAKALGVSPSTVWRWLRKPDHELSRERMVALHRRAILRGRGHYLWPPVDAATLRRGRHAATTAERSLTRTPSDRDAKIGRTLPHVVELIYYPRAHVYGLTAHQTHKHSQRIRNRGGITLDTIECPSYWAAVLLREQLLDQVGAEHRVIAPSDMVRTGRTHTWLEKAGRPSLHHVDKAAG